MSGWRLLWLHVCTSTMEHSQWQRTVHDCTLPTCRMLQPVPATARPGGGPGPHPVAALGACLSTRQNADAAFISPVAELWKRNSANSCGMQQLFRTGARTEINKENKRNQQGPYPGGGKRTQFQEKTTSASVHRDGPGRLPLQVPVWVYKCSMRV